MNVHVDFVNFTYTDSVILILHNRVTKFILTTDFKLYNVFMYYYANFYI